MLTSLSLDHIINHLHKHAEKLPDKRKQSNNNLTYSMADALLSAFAVFFMQSPSFLAHQRDMKRKKGVSNATELFKIANIPSDPQTRNILDDVGAEHFYPAMNEIVHVMRKLGYLEAYQGYRQTELVSLDGFTFHSSTQLDCPQCSTRCDSKGRIHYYHTVIEPVIVHPDQPYVIPLFPEFVTPQDGKKKQDCERNALKRWLAKYCVHLKPKTKTFLGDALQSNQPLCQLIAEKHAQFFIFVCKPDGHKVLYEWIELWEHAGKLGVHQSRKWNGRHGEIWSYRFARDIPLRGGDKAFHVNWLELTITHEKTKERLYYNSWVTNHAVDAACVAGIAKAGRAYWKVENESHNTLTNQGYHIKHNFGHQGKLANLLFTLNIIAFLMHTVLEITNARYQQLRRELGRRDVFFNDMEALTRYILFASWEALWEFMADGLELGH